MYLQHLLLDRSCSCAKRFFSHGVRPLAFLRFDTDVDSVEDFLARIALSSDDSVGWDVHGSPKSRVVRS
jgi:hypothetical protein